MYPSGKLAKFIATLEDSFTIFFSSRSMSDFASFLHRAHLPMVGCPAHDSDVSVQTIKFYVLLRFRFYTKSLNNDRSSQQE